VVRRAVSVLLSAGLCALAAGCGEDTGSGSSRAAGANAGAGRAAQLRQAKADAALIAARRSRPRAVEPQAGVLAGEPGAAAPVQAPDTSSDPSPSVSATGGAIAGDAALRKADRADTAAVNSGIALPPITAPEQVNQIIQAGNQIARTPYLWGGGHGRWLDHGYDCSGSVSYALAAGGLLSGPLTSGSLARWGRPGRGKWVTIYANAGHVFMVVAGVRFDTSGEDGRTPSRWQTDGRSFAGFAVRHPPGL
jgi:hypothetical protein